MKTTITATTKKYSPKMGSEIGNGYVNPFIVSAEEHVSYKYKCRLFGTYDGSEDFLHTLEVLEQAEETDTVELHISGPGGSLDAVITLMHAVDKCKAHVHAVLTGSVASAATLPALQADSYEVHRHTEFMFHTASFGVAIQKCHDVVDEVVHTKQRVEEILREEYKHFFTEEELDAMMLGKTFWMNAEEFQMRYEMRNELIEKEMQQIQEEESE